MIFTAWPLKFIVIEETKYKVFVKSLHIGWIVEPLCKQRPKYFWGWDYLPKMNFSAFWVISVTLGYSRLLVQIGSFCLLGLDNFD